MLVALSLATLGCQRESGAPALLGFAPASPSVHVNESIYVRVMYDAKDARLGNFSWTVAAGTIIGDGLSAVIYAAPPTPGTYRVSVTVAYGSRGKTVSLAGAIQVLPASAPVAKGPEVPSARDVAIHHAPGKEVSEPDTRSMIDRIVQQGRLRVAVDQDFAPFSFLDAHGNRVGFDVDLVRECARRWLGDPNAITLIPVQTSRRIPTLLEGKVDIIAAALTNTPARQRDIAFSHTYFKDGQRLLVRADSAVADVCDLNGKQIVVTRGSTAVQNVQTAAKACGFTAELVYVNAQSRAVEMVLKGEATAFSTDGIALERFAAGKPLQVVGNHFSDEPYGLGLAKGETEFLRLVNLTLEAMYADGTFAALYYKWFQESLRPYPIPFVVTGTADPTLLKLAHTDLPPLFPPVPEPAPLVREYTVKQGDTLSRLAGKFYGDVSPASWKRIYEANKAVIGPNPSRLRIGMRLRIPQP
jgi:ABC-type amino acid transport substrate-binding protein/phage tail protein X